MKTVKSQRGMTGIGWMIVISLILFFAYTVILLLPIYLENQSVKSVINDLADGTETFATVKDLRSIINKRLDINMATSVSSSDIIISRDADLFLVEIEYEVRESFLGNIDLLIKFKSVEEVSARDE
ncbi:hypothetical protein MNBD_GAMMA22-769 [hydrothermal vent metagenome]|uniref:DUF4845 domain-containing protein n=1 Tax=hydrothermal vent metagenome TaxID=652676 RepID=A0A3B0ZWD0_9ZZZZ